MVRRQPARLPYDAHASGPPAGGQRVLVREFGVVLDQPARHHQVPCDVRGVVLGQCLEVRLRGPIEFVAGHVVRNRGAGIPPRPRLVFGATGALVRLATPVGGATAVTLVRTPPFAGGRAAASGRPIVTAATGREALPLRALTRAALPATGRAVATLVAAALTLRRTTGHTLRALTSRGTAPAGTGRAITVLIAATLTLRNASGPTLRALTARRTAPAGTGGTLAAMVATALTRRNATKTTNFFF